MPKQRGGLEGAALGAVVIGATIGGILILAMTAGCCSGIAETCRQHGGPTQSLLDCFACCGETCSGVISNSFRCLMRQFLNSTGRNPNQAIEITITPTPRNNRVAPERTVNPLELFELSTRVLSQSTSSIRDNMLSVVLPGPSTTPTGSQSGTPMASPIQTEQMTRSPSVAVNGNFISKRLYHIIRQIVPIIFSEGGVKFKTGINEHEFNTKLQNIVESYLRTTDRDLLSLTPASIPKIVVNPGGEIFIAKIANNSVQTFINEIVALFVAETEVTVTIPGAGEGGSHKNKILLLGRHRNIIREGRRQFVNIKGHKVPLADAKNLEKKIKLNKKK